MFCPVLEFKEEKQTSTKVEGGNVNFFLFVIARVYLDGLELVITWAKN